MNRGAALAVLGLLLGPGCRERHDAGGAHGGDHGEPAAAVAPARIQQAGGSFVAVIQRAAPGVVAIRAAQPVKAGPASVFPGAEPDAFLGTGFVIEAGGTFVLTNDHIAAAGELSVVFADGQEAPVRVLGRDPRLDLALLKIDLPRLPALPLGDSDALQLGEPVVVLGNPGGSAVSAAHGHVSSLGGDGSGFRAHLQVDAAIHRANSGGPVLDATGQVIGIAVATETSPLGFAIPISRVREVVTALRDHGQVARAWLGVLVKPVPADPGGAEVRGALVTDVIAGSPAAKAGLRVGDVITSWGGKSVDHRTLAPLVATAPIGKPSALTVLRAGAEVPLTVVGEKMPE